MRNLLLSLLVVAVIFSSCDFLGGKKQDDTLVEIFEEGAIDPNTVVENVGYVPILPFFSGFNQPIDIFAGYDEMIYVLDADGLHVLDQTGTKQDFISIRGGTAVTQDRQLHTYVAARVDFDGDNDGTLEDLPAIFHYTNTFSGNATVIDTIIHPFDDRSRDNTSFRGADDEAVSFTGLATYSDNRLIVSRTGPTNDLSSISQPDNAILFYDETGFNTSNANGLNPLNSSLKSVLGVSSIASFAAPPQSTSGISDSEDFLFVQSDPMAEYNALWIDVVFDAEDGTNSYNANGSLLNFDTSKANGFMYSPNRFSNPQDIYVAPDQTGYIFVVDAGTDSLYQFTQKGFEGVNPPPTSTETKQIIASFGGSGNGQFNFIDPSGVCYLRKVVYVADKGNNRICRYKLSTDLE